MVLSDVEIERAIESGRLKIDPIPKKDAYTTTAVDLALGNEFRRWKKQVEGIELIVDPSDAGFSFAEVSSVYTENVALHDGAILVKPHEFVLGITKERVELGPTLAARVEGRSTLARLGLSIHVTAPTIHAGFRGNITLEITNHGGLPLRLRPGMNICQLIIEEVCGTPSAEMVGEFQDQTSTMGRG